MSALNRRGFLGVFLGGAAASVIPLPKDVGKTKSQLISEAMNKLWLKIKKSEYENYIYCSGHTHSFPPLKRLSDNTLKMLSDNIMEHNALYKRLKEKGHIKTT